MAAMRAAQPPVQILQPERDEPQSGESRALPSSRFFLPGINCQTVTRAHRAALLIDGAAYFDVFVRAALRARQSIVIVGWDFHSATPLHAPETVPGRLGEFLNWLARRRRNLRINVLTWDCPLVFSKGRESQFTRSSWRPHRRVSVCYDDHCAVGSALHQKIVVIDGAVAFCGGIDLTLSRWDTPEHLTEDPRRTDPDTETPYPPFHDAMLAVDGAAARSLQSLVSQRWLRATGSALPDPRAGLDPWPQGLQPAFTDVNVAIARTVAESAHEPAVVEVRRLYLDLIAAARHSIYLENQYLTCAELGDALAARLGDPRGPEIIAVVRPEGKGWLEAPTMGALRSALLHQLHDADRYGRFRAYYPCLKGEGDDTCCDLHSKLMIVDDEWLRVGSANFANRSMAVDMECDLAIEASGDPHTRAAITAARDQLIAEHLGRSVPALRRAIRSRRSLVAAIDSLAGSEGRTLRPVRPAEPSLAIAAIAGVVDPEKPVGFWPVRQWLTQWPNS